MGKMLFTAIAMSAVLGANAPMAGAESAKANPKAAKHVHSEKEHTCDKCKKAEKDCKCDEKAKHDHHDHEEGSHDHKDEKKAK